MTGKFERGRLAAFLLVLAAFFAAARLLPASRWAVELRSWIAGLGPAAAPVYGLVYVAGALFFVPGILLTLGAGLVFGLARGIVLVSIASTAAAALAFLIARYAARARVAELAKRNAKFRAVDAAIGKGGWRIVALLRLSPIIPFGISNYLYGLTAVRFGPYILASWLGMLPATVLYVSLGAAGRIVAAGGRENPWQIVLLAAGIAATIAVTVLLARIAKKELAAARVAGDPA